MQDKTGDSVDGRIERAKDAALGRHDSNPSHVDEAGEGVGGIGGVLAGAAIGSAAGPIGTIIGGLAGAVGGWWAGRAVTEAASHLTHEDDEYYRAHYERTSRTADRSYDDARPAYQLGQLAAANPDYAGRDWSDVSSEIRRGWSVDHARKYGDWETVSGYASEGYDRGRNALSNAEQRADTKLHGTADRISPVDDIRP